MLNLLKRGDFGTRVILFIEIASIMIDLMTNMRKCFRLKCRHFWNKPSECL